MMHGSMNVKSSYLYLDLSAQTFTSHRCDFVFSLKIKRKDEILLSVCVFDNTESFEPVDHFSRNLI